MDWVPRGGLSLMLGRLDWVPQGSDWVLWGIEVGPSGPGAMGQGMGLVLGTAGSGLGAMGGGTGCLRGSNWEVEWVQWDRGRTDARAGTGYLGPGWCSRGWQCPDPYCPPTTVPINIATLFPQPPAITLQRQVPPASSWPPRASHLMSSWPASSKGEGGGHPRVQGPPPQPAPSTHQLGCTCHLAGWGLPHSPGHTYAWVGDG